MNKKCLIISDGPVPAPEHDKVEGGGLRCWGLAKGLLDNDKNMEVTVAYNEAYKNEKKFTSSYEGVRLSTWNIGSISKLVEDYDTVIVSYCMGDLSTAVASSLSTSQQLVLDCYVPIYVEASARDSNDMDGEYYAFQHDVPKWAGVLRRGDLFLCASEPQKKFYEGVLAGLGRVNPATYGSDLIRVVPYGIYREEAVQESHPIQKLIGSGHEKFKKILWFGGIYPWFDLRDLIRAVEEINKSVPSKLIIVGAKNPFNGHPDFLRIYDELMSFIKDNGYEDMVLVQDWVSFDTRADWYLDSDVVVVINKLGQENSLAWRTRLVDFTWANLPIVTNGGDPVSNMLSAAGAAKILDGLTPKEVAKSIVQMFDDEKRLATMKNNLIKVREMLYWDNATKALTDDINAHTRSQDFERYGFYEGAGRPDGTASRWMRKLNKIKRVPAYARKYGIRATVNTVLTVIKRRAGRYIKSSADTQPRVVVVSHQLDLSGAPFVIMDVASSMKKSYPKLPLEFYTFNPSHNDNIVELNRNGIKPKILHDRDSTIDFHDGDVVVLNTVAHSQPLKHQVFSGLESGRLKKLFWYVHEDEPELIFNPGETKHIKSLLDAGLIEIVVAAVKTRDNYRRHFGNTKSINIQKQRIITPKKYHRVLSADTFNDKLRFILPGTIGDGRKGQLPVFYAFSDFYNDNYLKNPEQYRDFELVYIGVENDFLSRQMLRHADKSLGGRFVSLGRMSHDDCNQEVLRSNVTICYSIRECLPLFVYEGMVMGHPILRNDSSGMEEQLVDGKNGFYLESNDFEQMKATIEKILNKKKTPNAMLARMSKESNKIATAQEANTYDAFTKKVYKTFNGRSRKR